MVYIFFNEAIQDCLKGEKWNIIAQSVDGRDAKECKEKMNDFWIIEKLDNPRLSPEKKEEWEFRNSLSRMA